MGAAAAVRRECAPGLFKGTKGTAKTVAGWRSNTKRAEQQLRASGLRCAAERLDEPIFLRLMATLVVPFVFLRKTPLFFRTEASSSVQFNRTNRI